MFGGYFSRQNAVIPAIERGKADQPTNLAPPIRGADRTYSHKRLPCIYSILLESQSNHGLMLKVSIYP